MKHFGDEKQKREEGKIRKNTEEVEKKSWGENKIEWRVLEGGDQV